jgi:hypothetical protein
MPSENRKTHDWAMEKVCEALAKRGFESDPIRKDIGETVHVIRRGKRKLDSRIEVHGGTVATRRITHFLAGIQPPDDPSYFVALVDLRQWFIPRFLVLMNQEARERWEEDPKEGRDFWVEGMPFDSDGTGFEKLDPPS